MRITSIKTSGPYKLISAKILGGNTKGKPVVLETVFIDYKDHELRYFTSHGIYTYFCNNFQHALRAILTDSISSLVTIS